MENTDSFASETKPERATSSQEKEAAIRSAYQFRVTLAFILGMGVGGWMQEEHSKQAKADERPMLPEIVNYVKEHYFADTPTTKPKVVAGARIESKQTLEDSK